MKKNILGIFLIASMLLANVVAVSADSYFAGDGTEASPYLIQTASDLTTLASLTNAAATKEYASKYYKLTADINMTGVDYVSVSRANGDANTPSGAAFTGTLDGDGYIISNITLHPYYGYAYTYGLIGYLGTGGTVKNLGVENIRLNGDSGQRLRIGGVAGVINGATIQNCYVRTAYFRATANVPTFCGGIAGYAVGSAGTITNCYSTGITLDLANTGNSGGILGSSGGTGYTAANCYTTNTKVQGTATNTNMTATNCYYSTTIANATAAALGAAFKTDAHTVNSGYPLLVWQSGFLGAGTAAVPYQIGTASDLTDLASMTNNAVAAKKHASKYYKLTADIDMTGVDYVSVSRANGDANTPSGAAFTGTLDGDGYIISNITLHPYYGYAYTYGLIGYLGTGGTVKNLGVENIRLNGDSGQRLRIGGVAGVINGATIQNCYVRTAYFRATANVPTFCGGIAGYAVGSAGTITNCYSTGITLDLANTGNSGGILGSSGGTGYTAANCYTTNTKVQGTATNTNMTATNCYYSTTIANATVANLNAGGSTAFKRDNFSKNSGHPLLSWEKDIDATLTFTESSGTLTASANITSYIGSTRDFYLIIAKYDGAAESELTNWDSATVTASASGTTVDTVTAANDENTVYKAFLLYGNDFFPVVSAQTLNFTNN